ncbi:MAG: L,D-transpeptidase family protein [Pseudomonadota bacterium]
MVARSDGRFSADGAEYRCALGKGGVVAYGDKREGDGASPIGVYRLRWGLYRSDRIEPPATTLQLHAIKPDDGWCDAPEDPAYNRFVRLPYPASCETLTRKDELYDILVVLDHNDGPPISGAGSAIFLHCAKPGYPPTRGCVAMARPDLESVLKTCTNASTLEIRR